MVYLKPLYSIFPPRNAILVALLYSGFISLPIYTKFIRKLSGAKNLCFCTIRDFGSPTNFTCFIRTCVSIVFYIFHLLVYVIIIIIVVFLV